MDISQLKTLIHVAELGSLIKAADRLGIAQPALSRQIRLLEKELGVLLFQRDGRGMILTEYGRSVLKHATNIMDEMGAIRAISANDSGRLKGLVMVGAPPTVTAIATVPLVEQIIGAHPELSIRLASAYTGHLIDWLLRGELDLAVAYNPQPLRTLRVDPILVEDLVYVQAGRRLEQGSTIRFADLAAEKLILPSPPHGLRSIVDDCAKKAGVKLQATLEADSFQVMIDLVERGFGGTVLPIAPIYPKVVEGVLSVAPITDPSPCRTLVLVLPADRAITPAVRFVASSIMEIAHRLTREGIWSGRMIDRSQTDADRADGSVSQGGITE